MYYQKELTIFMHYMIRESYTEDMHCFLTFKLKPVLGIMRLNQ